MLRNLTGREACHSGELRNFRSENAEQWQCCTTFRPADMFTPSAYDTAVWRPTSCRYFSSLRMISRRAGFSASAELLVPFLTENMSSKSIHNVLSYLVDTDRQTDRLDRITALSEVTAAIMRLTSMLIVKLPSTNR